MRCLSIAVSLLVSLPAAALEIDFEDLGANLPIDGNAFYDGRSEVDASDPDASDFETQGATFNNEFTEFFPGCCWQGWSYSQTTDTTTSGPGNQYSAITGSGVNGSATYGVGFAGGEVGASDIVTIDLGRELAVQGAYFTNTTWAARSMQNGDGFAGPFGGASGDEPDFLVLTVSGFDGAGVFTGAVDLFLADYTFTDDGQDFILMDWTWLDLSTLGLVRTLDFTIASSDTAFGFINTPAYFAMDDLVAVPEPSSALLLAVGALLLRATGGRAART